MFLCPTQRAFPGFNTEIPIGLCPLSPQYEGSNYVSLSGSLLLFSVQAMFEGILVDIPFATFFLSKLKQK